MAASASVDSVTTTRLRGPLRFVTSAALGQVVTYLLVGLIASRALDYADILGRPAISAYYLPYGSVDFVVSTVLQLVRGILFGLVLLPFRGVLAGSRWGWLWLWTVFVAVGILGTPAAAPSSFEGLLYTRIPLWFHAVGLPEMLLQTLLFSVLVHRALRAETHPLGQRAHVLVGALATACIAFLGYTAVSLVFAFAAGVDLASGSDAGVLGQFAAPLILHFVAVLVAKGRWWRAVRCCSRSAGPLSGVGAGVDGLDLRAARPGAARAHLAGDDPWESPASGPSGDMTGLWPGVPRGTYIRDLEVRAGEVLGVHAVGAVDPCRSHTDPVGAVDVPGMDGHEHGVRGGHGALFECELVGGGGWFPRAGGVD